MDRRAVVSGFAAALWRGKTLRTRTQLLRFQQRKIDNFLTQSAPNVRAFEGGDFRDWAAIPTMDKARLMGDFAAYNVLGMDAQTAFAAIETGKFPPHYALGCSTGTSGNRGAYIVSTQEQSYWLGVMLARVLAPFWAISGKGLKRRIALLLPTLSPLYQRAAKSSFLELGFFDTNEGIEHFGPALAAFAPDILVAAPHALAALIFSDIKIFPHHIICGAEVLEPREKERFTAHFGCRVDEIYMATEGLIATPCQAGHLHVQEDFMRVELEAIVGASDLYTPILTDFSRHSQIMLRYRLNDLIALDEAPCPCGSPRQKIKAIVGRADDVLWLKNLRGHQQMLTPDLVRNAIIDSDRRIEDFRVVQAANGAIDIVVSGQNIDLAVTQKAIQTTVERLGLVLVPIDVRNAPIRPHQGGKLRRIVSHAQPTI